MDPLLYSTTALIGIITPLTVQGNFLRTLFFGATPIEFDTPEVMFDRVFDDKRIAPWVSPYAKGTPSQDRGFQTDRFAPGYIKPIDRIDAHKLGRRRPGEPIGGEFTLQQRRDLAFVDYLAAHKTKIERREEVMASEILRTGDVEQPQVGEIIFLDDKVLTLTLPPEIDAEGLTWYCDLPELERTLEVLAPARQPDAHGDPEDTFAVILTLAAARQDRSGTEGEQPVVAQIEAWQQATFFIPWSEEAAAITPAYRLREGGRTFDIQTVAEVGTQSAIEITALAKAA
jgi:hypothetical protein